MNEATLKTLVEAGIGGIALSLIWLIYYIIKSTKEERKEFTGVVKNHMTYNTDALRKQSNVLSGLVEAIRSINNK